MWPFLRANKKIARYNVHMHIMLVHSQRELKK